MIMKYPIKGKHTKPIAFFKLQNKTIMKKSNVKTSGIKDLTTTTADDIVLDFGDQAQSLADIAVGMAAIIVPDPLVGNSGGVPDGEYVTIEGGTWIFDKGTLIEMIPPEDEKIPTSTMGPKVKAIKLKGKLFVARGKKYLPIVGGLRLKGKLYVPGTDGKFNTLAKDQKVGISRYPGKPKTGV